MVREMVNLLLASRIPIASARTGMKIISTVHHLFKHALHVLFPCPTKESKLLAGRKLLKDIIIDSIGLLMILFKKAYSVIFSH